MSRKNQGERGVRKITYKKKGIPSASSTKERERRKRFSFILEKKTPVPRNAQGRGKGTPKILNTAPKKEK